jgi:alkylation response protein AidB-like acyl-CoA dehydrogenase
MDIRLSPKQDAWRQEVIAFLEQEITPEFLADVEQQDAVTSYASPEFSRKLAERGWLTLHWPPEYGGQGRSLMDLTILNEQLGFFRAPVGWHNIATEWVAMPLMEFGTEEQKRRFLPPIARAEVSYAPAFTEPHTGSDLARLTTTAIRTGDAYEISGHKAYIGPAHRADYLWLLARTDPTARPHEGLSMFIVDVKTPGIRIEGVRTMNHGRLNDVYLDDVRVPVENRVGPENHGWRIAMATLNIERSGIYYVAANQSWLWDLIQFAREHTRRGRPLIADPLVRQKFAYWATELEAQRMLSWRIAWLQSQGASVGAEASIQGLRTRMFEHEFANFGVEVLGLYGQLSPGSRWAPLRGRIEKLYLGSSSQHAGGTTEIQKNIVAIRGLGLPRG